MKTVTGRVISAEPISLSKAATILSRFVSSENGASQDVGAYLRRAAAAFTELKSFHRETKETKTRSNARNEWNQADEFEELGRAKGIDDLVENGGKVRFRKSEVVREDESIYGREQDEIKEDKKKKNNNKEEDVVCEKVKEKLEEEQRNEERKKKKSKKNKEEDVIDKKVNEKLEEQQRNEEREERKKEKKKKKKKKKRKSDGETGSDERKSKKKKKSKEIDG